MSFGWCFTKNKLEARIEFAPTCFPYHHIGKKGKAKSNFLKRIIDTKYNLLTTKMGRRYVSLKISSKIPVPTFSELFPCNKVISLPSTFLAITSNFPATNEISNALIKSDSENSQMILIIELVFLLRRAFEIGVQGNWEFSKVSV